MKLLGRLFSMIAAVVLSALLPLTVMAENDSESKHHYTQTTHLSLSETANDDPRDNPRQ